MIKAPNLEKKKEKNKIHEIKANCIERILFLPIKTP
jgi:hypothetical protein